MKNSNFLSSALLLLCSCFCLGQSTANFTASVTIIQPVGITTTSDMDFANLDAKSGGEVILTPNSTRLTSGGIELAEGGKVSAATFEITGQPGFTYGITLPEDLYWLTNGSDRILIRDFTSDQGGTGLLDQVSQRINVGATIVVNSNQIPGTYRSQSPLVVTVNYN